MKESLWSITQPEGCPLSHLSQPHELHHHLILSPSSSSFSKSGDQRESKSTLKLPYIYLYIYIDTYIFFNWEMCFSKLQRFLKDRAKPGYLLCKTSPAEGSSPFYSSHHNKRGRNKVTEDMISRQKMRWYPIIFSPTELGNNLDWFIRFCYSNKNN